MSANRSYPNEVLIVGAGIGGLAAALELHRRGIPCRIFESAPEIKAVGVGINLLPHATQALGELGLEPALAKVAVETQEAAFFNRFGQLIYQEPLGRRAGYPWPQFSIHRGDLQAILLDAVKARIGADRIHLGWHCLGFEQHPAKVTLKFREHSPMEGKLAVGCDGIHSVIRKQLYPGEGEPRYSGVNMWRGVTRWKPVLSGASMLRAGWLATGKLVHYPIRSNVDGQGRQLVNWLWEIETPQYKRWDWNRPARVEDFIAAAESWRFDWLDVPAFLRAADLVLEYPMVDKDPLPAWSFGRVTLLGDAAHPMVPRGSNGAGQAILDANALAECLSDDNALKKYEALRLGPTSNVVLENRRNPPDAILREVYERTGDRPFERIEAVISAQELAVLSQYYRIATSRSRDTTKRACSNELPPPAVPQPQRRGARARGDAGRQARRPQDREIRQRRSQAMTITRHDPSSILSNAVQHGDTVYLAGVVAKSLDQDVKGQTKQILDDIDRLLAKCGSSKSKVLSATIWVTDIRNRAPMNEVWTAWVDPKNLPARACVEAKLADPKALVEIMVIAGR